MWLGSGSARFPAPSRIAGNNAHRTRRCAITLHPGIQFLQICFLLQYELYSPLTHTLSLYYNEGRRAARYARSYSALIWNDIALTKFRTSDTVHDKLKPTILTTGKLDTVERPHRQKKGARDVGIVGNK